MGTLVVRRWQRGPLAGIRHRPYNGPKPHPPCARCRTELFIGAMYWRGLPNLVRACDPCGKWVTAGMLAEAARRDLVSAQRVWREYGAAIASGAVLDDPV